MRVDAHHHVWDLDVRPQPWTEGTPTLERSFHFAELRPLLAAYGVEGTVVVQTVTVPEETPELLALAASESEIRGVVGWVDLTAADVADRLAELRDLPGGEYLASIRHQVQGETDPRWLLRDGALRGLRAVADSGLAYDLVVRPDQLPMVTDAVRAVPELRFVLDHLGKPPIAGGDLTAWHADIRTLAACANVSAKLSGLVTEADHASWTVDDLRPCVETALAAFGPDRLMVGSDWPACLPAATYHQVYEAADELLAGASAAERAALYGRTAAAWYRFPTI